ncbi:hypothetical protein pb186bvf_020277 [Paramecium bursaria]
MNMITKLFTYQDFKDVPSQFLCQICFQIQSKIKIVDKKPHCLDCLEKYNQTNDKATNMNIYFCYYSTCICNVCDKTCSVDKFQKHFIKCSENLQTTKLIQDSFIIDMNELKQCECIIKKDFASSRQCNKCFIILCQSCKSSHQDCNQSNYQNCIAQCRREQCQALIKQNQLVTHALKCQFRERKCYNSCEWKGIQRDYNNHVEHCFRGPNRFQRESTRLFQFEFYQIQSQKRYIQFKNNIAQKQNLKLKQILFQLENL